MGWFGNDLKHSQYNKREMEQQWAEGFIRGIFVGAIGVIIMVVIYK